MLPFIKPKQVAGLIISHRKPDGNGIQESHTEGNEDDGLETCAEELIRAVHSKDPKAVVSALRSAFEILDSEPHEEGEHTNEASPHTYENQNEKAAK